MTSGERESIDAIIYKLQARAISKTDPINVIYIYSGDYGILSVFLTTVMYSMY